jgi:hypothetical protein
MAGGKSRTAEVVSIPTARALAETDKAICCDFGDDKEHWVPQSQIGPHSEVKRKGDSGHLVVSKWWAEQAGAMGFVRAPSPWARFRNFRHRLQELDALLPKDDPSRAIIKTLCDAIRADLGIEQPQGGDGGGVDGGPKTSA